MPDDLLLSIPFGASGIGTKDDPFQSQKPLALENFIFNKTGRLDRRWGYQVLGTGILNQNNSITNCTSIQNFNNELLLFDGSQSYSYLTSTNQWAPRGTMVSVKQLNTPIIANNDQQLSPDFGTLDGVSLYAWEDTRGGIRYSMIDEATGTAILADQPLFTGMPSTISRPKVLAYPAAGLLFIFFVNTIGQLCFCSFSPQSASPRPNSFCNVLLNGLSNPAYFDATVSGSNCYLIYYTPTGIMLSNFLSNLTTSWSVQVASQSTVPNGALNVVADSSNNAWVTYADSGSNSLSCSTAIYNSSGSSLLSPTQVIAGDGYLQSLVGSLNSSGILTVLAEAQGSQTYNNHIFTNTITSTGSLGIAASSAPVLIRSVGLASKPFTYNGNLYINVSYQTNDAPTYFTLMVVGSTFQIVSKCNAGLGGGLISNSDYILPECPQISNGIFRYPNLQKGIINTEAGQLITLLGINSTKLDFIDNNQSLSSALNQSLYTVGGILQSYDGMAYHEVGFHVDPENIILTPSGSGGNLGTGTYFYCVVYEWVDKNQQTQYSAPSLPQQVVFNSGTTNSVQLLIPTLRLTNKSRVRISIYRTAANGTLLTRVTSNLGALSLINDPTVDSLTFTDTLSDTAIASNGAMYTQPLSPGNPILENTAPPACSLIATYADRIFLAGLDDPYTIWFSQQSSFNLPAQFSADLTLRIDPDGGPITALARMDDKLIVFKENAIFYLLGQGPDATGAQNDFGDLIQIPSAGIGCINQNAIIPLENGLLFPSDHGIWQLGRGLDVSYKGSPVDNFNNLTITSGTLIAPQWAIFTTLDGTALIYDYFYDAWKTFTNHVAIDGDIYLANNHSYVFANPNGTVYLQTIDQFSDNGNPIPVNFTSNWITPAAFGGALQGFQRLQEVYLLGTYQGSHTLNISVAFNNNDSFSQFEAIPVDAALNLAKYGVTSPYGSDPYFGGVGYPNSGLYAFRVHIHKECSSFKLQITDQQTGTGNAGFTLSSLLVVGQVKSGPMRLPPTKIFGTS